MYNNKFYLFHKGQTCRKAKFTSESDVEHIKDENMIFEMNELTYNFSLVLNLNFYTRIKTLFQKSKN